MIRVALTVSSFLPGRSVRSSTEHGQASLEGVLSGCVFTSLFASFSLFLGFSPLRVVGSDSVQRLDNESFTEEAFYAGIPLFDCIRLISSSPSCPFSPPAHFLCPSDLREIWVRPPPPSAPSSLAILLQASPRALGRGEASSEVLSGARLRLQSSRLATTHAEARCPLFIRLLLFFNRMLGPLAAFLR